jgi:hypothetical protein
MKAKLDNPQSMVAKSLMIMKTILLLASSLKQAVVILMLEQLAIKFWQ